MTQVTKAAKLTLACIVLVVNVLVFSLENLGAHYTLTEHSDPAVEATLSILNGLLALWSGIVIMGEVWHRRQRESRRASTGALDSEPLTDVTVSTPNIPALVGLLGYTGRWRSYKRETQNSQQ